MDAAARAQLAEAGRKKLEAFRRQKNALNNNKEKEEGNIHTANPLPSLAPLPPPEISQTQPSIQQPLISIKNGESDPQAPPTSLPSSLKKAQIENNNTETRHHKEKEQQSILSLEISPPIDPENTPISSLITSQPSTSISTAVLEQQKQPQQTNPAPLHYHPAPHSTNTASINTASNTTSTNTNITTNTNTNRDPFSTLHHHQPYSPQNQPRQQLQPPAWMAPSLPPSLPQQQQQKPAQHDLHNTLSFLHNKNSVENTYINDDTYILSAVPLHTAVLQPPITSPRALNNPAEAENTNTDDNNDNDDNNTNNNNTDEGIGQPLHIEHQQESTENVSKLKNFKLLQQHIDTLTEEKFTHQRQMDQLSQLADKLSSENELLTERLNAAARRAEDAEKTAENGRKEVSTSRDKALQAIQERDAYEMSARESSQRIKSLAGEVVALEEMILKYKSREIKQKSGIGMEEEKEREKKYEYEISKLKKEIENLSKEKMELKQYIDKGENERIEMKRQLENSSRRVVELQDRIRYLENENEEMRVAIHQQKSVDDGNGSIGSVIDVGVEIINGKNVAGTIHLHDGTNTLDGVGGAEKIEEGQKHGGNENREEDTLEFVAEMHTGDNDVGMMTRPPASALVAAAAMSAFEIQKQQQKEEEEERKGEQEKRLENNDDGRNKSGDVVPPEIRALLPPLTWVPGLEDFDPGVGPVIERLFASMSLLEQERKSTNSLLMGSREEVERLRMGNAQLQGRLEALQQRIELGIGQKQNDGKL